MDIVFHRNCLDGAYSAYLMYLFCKTLTNETYQQLLEHFKSHQSNKLKVFPSQKIMLKQCLEVNQQFFHIKPQIAFHSVSMYAGDLFPIVPSKQGNILFLLDISPTQKDMMISMSQKFTFVIILDHHTSFSNCQKFITQNNLKNVLYLWDQTKCAAQIVFDYLLNSFGFPKNYPKNLQQDLVLQINYVSGNDLKKRQNKKSKQFVLGFYYFQIQLSHHNVLLFKRIWSLNMQLLMEKGQRIYKQHLQSLARQVQNCQIWEMIPQRFKKMNFLASDNRDRSLSSDLGSILSFLSAKNKYSNLGMIYKLGANDCRISFRSYQFIDQQPQALKISEFYGGGGHLCAAGCYINKHTFKQQFKFVGRFKPSIKFSIQQIENILFVKEV